MVPLPSRTSSNSINLNPKKKKKKSFQFFSFSLVLSTQKIIASLLSRIFFWNFIETLFHTDPISRLLACFFSVSPFLSLLSLLTLFVIIININFFSLSLSLFVWFNRLDVTGRGILLPAAHGETKLGPLVDDRFAYCNIITQAHID